MKKSTTHAIGVPKREEGWSDVIFEEILTKHFPKPLKDIKLHIQVALRSLSRLYGGKKCNNYTHSQTVEKQRKRENLEGIHMKLPA